MSRPHFLAPRPRLWLGGIPAHSVAGGVWTINRVMIITTVLILMPPCPQGSCGSGVTLTPLHTRWFICLDQRLCKGGHVAQKKKKNLRFITVSGDNDSP